MVRGYGLGARVGSAGGTEERGGTRVGERECPDGVHGEAGVRLERDAAGLD